MGYDRDSAAYQADFEQHEHEALLMSLSYNIRKALALPEDKEPFGPDTIRFWEDN